MTAAKPKFRKLASGARPPAGMLATKPAPPSPRSWRILAQGSRGTVVDVKRDGRVAVRLSDAPGARGSRGLRRRPKGTGKDGRDE